MKAEIKEVPVTLPPRLVTLTMSELEARRLKVIATHDLSIPDAIWHSANAMGLSKADVKATLNSITDALYEANISNK